MQHRSNRDQGKHLDQRLLPPDSVSFFDRSKWHRSRGSFWPRGWCAHGLFRHLLLDATGNRPALRVQALRHLAEAVGDGPLSILRTAMKQNAQVCHL